MIHSLDIENFQKDLGAERYSDITNPLILASIFRLYYALDSDHVKEILKICENNVSNFYYNKNKNINSMSHLQNSV